jgi:AraC family transcriptional regulator of arabinose operon
MKRRLDHWVPKINRLLGGRLTRSAIGSDRPHGLDHWQLIFVTGGLLQFGQSPPRHEFAAGDLILTPPHLPLYYQPRELWSCHYAVFTPWPHWAEWLDWPEALPGTRWLRLPDAKARQVVRALFDEVVAHNRSGYREELLGLNALERLLIATAMWNPARQQAGPDARIAAAQQFLLDNLGRMVAVPEVAQATGLSSSRLAHLFRTQTGLTPMQFLDRQRMHRACQLLASTPLPIKEIAAQVGYPDIYHFSQRFKKLLGQNPRNYRQTHSR